MLDAGGLRRTQLRGREYINKRYLCGIIAFNLSLLMRKLLGVCTARQLAALARAILRLMAAILHLIKGRPVMSENRDRFLVGELREDGT